MAEHELKNVAILRSFACTLLLGAAFSGQAADAGSSSVPSHDLACDAPDITLDGHGNLAWSARLSDGTVGQTGHASLRFYRADKGTLYFEMTPASLEEPSVAFIEVRVTCASSPGFITGKLQGDGWHVTSRTKKPLTTSMREPLKSMGGGAYDLQVRVECTHACWGRFEELHLSP